MQHSKVVAHIVFNITLLVIYALVFGRKSIRSLFDDAIIVTKKEEKHSSIIPPGIVKLREREVKVKVKVKREEFRSP